MTRKDNLGVGIKEKPYNRVDHEYKGYKAYKYYNCRPFTITTPDGKTLRFKSDNAKGYNRISFAEICRRVDNGTLSEYYGELGVDKGIYLY